MPEYDAAIAQDAWKKQNMHFMNASKLRPFGNEL
jgi:hypothetical protein